MLTIVTDVRGVCLSVCLSRGSTRPHCAKTAERIKMLFGVNTVGSHRTLCYTGVLITPQRGRGVGENFANYGPTAYLRNG